MSREIPLKENPFKKDSKAWKFFEICGIDYKTGYSKIVVFSELKKHELLTTNGGDWCRSDGTLGKYFNIDRKKDKGKIISVQLVGYKKNNFSNKINQKIRDYYLSLNCKVLAVGGKNIEIDHKDGRKDDFGLPNIQNKDDFQPLHRNANLAKRQHCINCKNSGTRFDAKNLGYKVSQWIGGNKYQGTCVGCFWYDPAEFNAKISENYVKDR